MHARSRFSAISFVALAAFAACTGAPPGGPQRPSKEQPSKAPVSAAGSSVPAGLEAFQITTIATETFGPYLARGGEGVVVAWASPSGEHRRWMTAGLDARGRRLAEPLGVADAPDRVGLVALRPLAPNPKAGGNGFALVSTWGAPGGVRVDAMLLGTRGELRAGPVPVAQGLGDVLWVEAFPAAEGALVLWAVREPTAKDKPESRASVYATALGRAGDLLDAPTRIVADARAWQARAVRGGAVVGWVALATGRGGPVRAVFVDAEGHIEGAPITLSAEPTAELDFDLAPVGDSVVAAWTDRRAIDASVWTAAIDARGALARPPAPATAPLGEQNLVTLAPPTGGGSAVLAWENLAAPGSGGRTVRVARIGSDGRVAPEAGFIRFLADDGSLPEIAATKDGVAALTLAPLCARNSSCTEAAIVPTFVELDAANRPRASEPFRIGEGGGTTLALAWALSCGSGGCLALGAQASAPTDVFAVSLGRASDAFVPAGGPVLPDPAPRVSQIRALATSEPLVDVDAVRAGSRVLTAWITYFDPTTPWVRLKKPTPDGKFAPLQASLRLRSLGPDGDAGDILTLSARARSLGGVDLAANAEGDALVAWSAIDEGDPQVFVTLVGNDGKKKKQRMLTRAKGESSDVAVTAVRDGWVVGWIDERDGHPEVYLVKLGKGLEVVGPERRLTHAAGAASGVTLAARSDVVLALWSDARGTEEGRAGIWALPLSPKDGSPLGTEAKLSSDGPHAHSPSLVVAPDGFAATWIEETPGASDRGRDSRACMARIDAAGKLVGAIARADDPAGGAPRATTIDCTADGCRAVVTLESPEGAWVAAWIGAGEALTRLGPAGVAHSIPPALVGTEVFYADEERGGPTKVRRATVVWK